MRGGHTDSDKQKRILRISTAATLLAAVPELHSGLQIEKNCAIHIVYVLKSFFFENYLPSIDTA